MRPRYLALWLPVLALVLLYRWPPAGPLPTTRDVQPQEPAPAMLAAPEPLDVVLPAAAVGREICGTLARHETVAAALSSSGLTAPQVAEATRCLGDVFDFRRAQAGARFILELSADDERLDYIRLENSLLDVYEASRDGADATLRSRKVEVPLETRLEPVGGEIRDSLYSTLDQAGELPELATLLADVFAWDIDFHRDQHPGDRFRVIVEKLYKDDTLVRYGRVLAAEYAGRVGTLRTFWYEPAGAPDKADYYLEDGRCARKLFLATPLAFTRISSRFSYNRRHPILGYRKAHLGVDYAAPRGTPVRAMAGGTVVFAGRHRGSGNLVKIRHRNGLMSSYAHLHRIDRAVRRGVRVKQKQRIGTVGSTGLATGPHLHFAVQKDGKHVNPQKLKLSRLDPVPPGQRADFDRMVAERLRTLEAIEPASRAPDARIAELAGATPATD